MERWTASAAHGLRSADCTDLINVLVDETMQRFFSVIVIFAILIVGGGFLWVRKSEEEAKVKRAEDLTAARRTFTDKARAAAREEDNDGYQRSIRTAIG